MNNEKSEVEQFFEAIAAKMNSQRKWRELNFMEQQEFCTAINIILQVVSVNQPQEENYV